MSGRKRVSQGPILPIEEPVVTKRVRTAEPVKEVPVSTAWSAPGVAAERVYSN